MVHISSELSDYLENYGDSLTAEFYAGTDCDALDKFRDDPLFRQYVFECYQAACEAGDAKRDSLYHF